VKPGQQIREYLLEEQIGEGGMATVWRARHVHLQEPVAIKVMSTTLMGDPDTRERFLQEARAMARLQHRNILGAKEFFEEDGVFYLVMPYIDSGTLEDRIVASGGPLPMDLVRSISAQILAALDFAHQKGIIHRDVKPSNIMLNTDGQAFLADFGIALMVGVDRKTRTGTSIGTPHYMSPEQILRPRAMDHRADVYSFGCVLYEMVCGCTPFRSEDEHGDSDYAIKDGHLREEVPAPRAMNPLISEGMERIILKALEKDPDLRYQGCGEFSRALAEEAGVVPSPGLAPPQRPPVRRATIVESTPPPSPAPPPPSTAVAKSGKPVGAIVAVVAGLATIGAAVGYFATRTSEPAPKEIPLASAPAPAPTPAAPASREGRTPEQLGITSVSASSTMKDYLDKGTGYLYRFTADQLVDGNLFTCWQASSSQDPWVRLDFGGDRLVSRVEVANGFQRTDALGDLFTMNDRIRVARIVFIGDGETAETIAFLPDEVGYKAFTFVPQRCRAIRIEVRETWPGTKWRHLSISEVRAFGVRV